MCMSDVTKGMCTNNHAEQLIACEQVSAPAQYSIQVLTQAYQDAPAGALRCACVTASMQHMHKNT